MSRKNRIEIEKAENGYMVSVWDYESGEDDEYGYVEPKKHVAEDEEGVMTLVKENL